MKTAKIRLESVKDPDGWGLLIEALDISDDMRRRHFEWAEYASLELEIDEELRVVGGRIVPLSRVR